MQKRGPGWQDGGLSSSTPRHAVAWTNRGSARPERNVGDPRDRAGCESNFSGTRPGAAPESAPGVPWLHSALPVRPGTWRLAAGQSRLGSQHAL